MDGRICGGATARLEMSRSTGLLLVKPISLASSSVILAKMFSTSFPLRLYSLYLFLSTLSSIRILCCLNETLVGVNLPHPRLTDSCSNGHWPIGASNLASSLNLFSGLEMWVILRNLSLCCSVVKSLSLEQWWQMHLRIFSTYSMNP